MISEALAKIPGVMFESYSPESVIPIERTDIAVFVGFAGSGPMNMPVKIGDTAQFAAVFGGSLVLPWKAPDGTETTAFLAPAVEAFFRNGGRSCWVIRVAGKNAVENVFALPCLLDARTGEDGAPILQPAFVKARSKGGWSDSLSVNVDLLCARRGVTALYLKTGGDSPEIEIIMRGEAAIVPVTGDCVRIMGSASAGEDGPILLAVADTVRKSGENESEYVITAREMLWFKRIGGFSEPFASVPTITVWRHSPKTFTAIAPITSITTANPECRFECSIAVSSGDSLVAPGSIALIKSEQRDFWCAVLESSVPAQEDTGEVLRLKLSCFWERIEGTDDFYGSPPAMDLIADLLRIDIAVMTENGPARSGELGLGSAHDSAWTGLKDDDTRFAEGAGQPVASALFPLSSIGRTRARGFAFPLMMSASDFWSPPTVDSAGLPDKGGLSRYDRFLFIDRELVDESERALAAKADFIRFQRSDARPLLGIHAAYYLDDAALIAVPDAVHQGPQEDIEWIAEWVADGPAIPAQSGKQPGAAGEDFGCCDPFPETPALSAEIDASNEKATLNWTRDPSCDYSIQRSPSRFFVPVCSMIADGVKDSSLTISLQGIAGAAYFRIRSRRNGNVSSWSDPVAITKKIVARYDLTEDTTVLEAVHKALLRLCAARGDIFCVLSLPVRFERDKALAWIASFRNTFDAISETTNALSYGALYHPWVLTSDHAGENRLIPPDGALCGLMAKKALVGGPWSAPGNEPLANAVALRPIIPEPSSLLFMRSGINLLARDARGFLPLTANTLTVDPEFDQIHVRRLLILLRRIILKQGTTYVFEPGNDSFRRMVERGFEETLTRLFARGAFAGRTPESSFRVDVDAKASLIDQGLFIVEIRIAPSMPMRFITVRLVQSSERMDVEEVTG